MRTLCLYNLNSKSAGNLDVKDLLRGRRYWGEVIFHSLQPTDINSPAWADHLGNVNNILIIGGDGTLHHTIQHLINRQIDINLIPSGTANDFASYAGLPSKPSLSLELLENGKTIKYDTICVNGQHVVSGGGFGLGYLVAQSALKLRNTRTGSLLIRNAGHRIYPLLLLWHSIVEKHEGFFLTVKNRSDVLEHRSYSCVFANQGKLGKNIVVAPETKATDGLFHFLLFKNPSCPSVLNSVIKIKMGHSDRDNYLYRREIEQVTVNFTESLPAFGDGELIKEAKEWEISCCKSSLNMRVPRNFHG
jgi:diacylglycerol kinase (ATP)